MENTIAHPEVVSRIDWLAERKTLLDAEKELTKHSDRVNAQRRRLSMVKLEKKYTFNDDNGKVSLLDLFEARRQLIVYHFMFDPDWDKGCPGCTGLVNSLGDLSMLGKRNTSFVLISRAPLEKLQRYKKEQGWDWPWYSSFESDFNYDFHVTQDHTIVPIQYNYRQQAELEARKAVEPYFTKGETHGLSVFFQLDDAVYHTYSTYARGCESVTDAYRLLDMTPYGRQEDFEDSPAGWPQKPTYGS
ncbi:MAG: putative dithiol-disulfide oxidoreductase, family [Planctomycetaceae bacterium]|nr:putative dithiol-disulfide oxidoreductase, family [Planctomycetaceae bacterium]